jgi:WD40 repeat protein
VKQKFPGLSVGFVIVLVAFGFAFYELRDAQNEAKTIRIEEMAAQSVSLRNTRFDQSLLLSVEAFGAADTPRTRGVLLDSVQANPQLIQYLRSDIGQSSPVAFSPDGKILATGESNGIIILWDPETANPLRQLVAKNPNGLGPVFSLAFTPDGKMLVAGIHTLYDDEGTIALWDVTTGQLIDQPLLNTTNSVYDLTLSPDGKTLAIAESVGISLWDMEKGQFVGKLPTQLYDVVGALNQSIGVSNPIFSPDGNILAALGGGNTITLWDTKKLQTIGQPLRVDEANSFIGICGIAFGPQGNTLVTVSTDNSITLWDLATRQPIRQYPSEPTGNAYSVGCSSAFSPDGRLVAYSDSSIIMLADMQTGQRIGQPLKGNSNNIGGMAFSRDGKMLVSASGHGAILWDLTSGRLLGQTLTNHVGSSIAFSPDGNTLASDDGPSVVLWNMTTHQPIEQLGKGNDLAFQPVAFSPDGKVLAAGNGQGITLWDIATGKPIGMPLSGYLDDLHSDQAQGVAFSPDGKIIAFDGGAGILLWDVATHQRIDPPLAGDVGNGSAFAFSPDGKILAVGDSLHTTSVSFDAIKLWSVATHQPIGQPLMHSDFVDCITFSPNGKILASCGGSTIIFWDVASQKMIGQPLTLPTNSLSTNLVFSPDGKILASGDYDNTIVLWDAATHQPIGQGLIGNDWPLNSVAFSPDGNTLATSSDKIILWDVNPLSWVKKICQRVGRNFTRSEWVQYFPDETYRATCPQWPLEPLATPVSTP